MKTLFLLAALNCPDTKVVNKTDNWNKFDDWTLSNAQKRCPKLYPNSPCLKLLVKRTDRDYTAICGRENGTREREVNYSR